MPIQVLGWEGYDDLMLLGPYKSAGGSQITVDAHLCDFAAAGRVIQSPNQWDMVNINSPYVRDVLHARGLIQPLQKEEQTAALATFPQFKEFHQWGVSPDGQPIGVCQRFGPFNLVVNTNAVSINGAEDQGFNLAADPTLKGRYGILAYDDFNVIHIAIASGFDPFQKLIDDDIAAFQVTAARWFEGAKMVSSDHTGLNRALIGGETDFYLGGGVYTASSARRAGDFEVRAITPRRGPAGGLGGVAFVEVNAVLAGTEQTRACHAFLDYLREPKAAVRAAQAADSANPVLQMADPAVFAGFSSELLCAMQWESLEEDLSRCVQYRSIPDFIELHKLLIEAKTAAGWN
jgi:spermidine/putrescine transport system substrate-binding protein